MSNNTSGIDETGSDTTESQAQQATKTYTQEEFDNHMAGLKASLTKKLSKQYEGLGDINELRQLKEDAEKRAQEQLKKRGEFDKILQEMAAKKDEEIRKRDAIISEYKIVTPLVTAAAKHRSVNPDQVKALLANKVRLNELGDVEVIDDKGAVRFNDKGVAIGVEDLVQEFLQGNPHFVQPTSATTNTKSSSNPGPNTAGKVNLAELDLRNAADRAIYAKAKAEGRLN